MTTPAAAATPGPRRILVRGVNWLGDAVMTTPALQRLRERFPQAHITLLTHEKLAALWQPHPSLDASIAFSPGEGPWSVAGRLRALDFQAALVLPNSLRSALEVWLARIPRRIGLARPGCNWLLTHRVSPRPGQIRMSRRSAGEVRRLIRLSADKPPSAAHRPEAGKAHQVHDYLHLAAAMGASPETLPPRLEIRPEEVQEARQALLPGHPPVLLGLNPGAEYGPAKRWPARNFAAIARGISGKLGNCLWLALGTAGDWELCDQIAREAEGRVLNLAGKTSLRQLMALLKLCRVVLTNDTGPMHVAAALGTPVVVPFGSTSPELTGPGLPGDSRHRLLKSGAPCSPCFRRECPIDFRCMVGITVEQVFKAVWQVVSLS
jgi:heptosyltransferase II